jgi:hypothetical protein
VQEKAFSCVAWLLRHKSPAQSKKRSPELPDYYFSRMKGTKEIPGTEKFPKVQMTWVELPLFCIIIG